MLQLENVRTLYQNLEGGLKTVAAGLAKLQQEMARSMEAQRQQGPTPSAPLAAPAAPHPTSLPSPMYISRPDTPGLVPPQGAAATSVAASAAGSAPSVSAAENAAVPMSLPQLQTTSVPFPQPLAGNTLNLALPTSAAALPGQQPATQIKNESVLVSAVKAEPMHVDNPSSPTAAADTAVKSEPGTSPAASHAAPSLVSALTTASPKDATDDALLSLLDDGDVIMPAIPADLQAELMSSASSSFHAAANFASMPIQATMDESLPMLTDDYAAELLASPRFALTDGDGTAATGGVVPAATTEAAEAAAASVAAVNAAVAGNTAGVFAFNAAAGQSFSPYNSPPFLP